MRSAVSRIMTRYQIRPYRRAVFRGAQRLEPDAAAAYTSVAARRSQASQQVSIPSRPPTIGCQARRRSRGG
eukprot:COSAG01_NODE_4243_length_5211_cov_7.043232_4_plen_71_part_00